MSIKEIVIEQMNLLDRALGQIVQKVSARATKANDGYLLVFQSFADTRNMRTRSVGIPIHERAVFFLKNDRLDHFRDFFWVSTLSRSRDDSQMLYYFVVVVRIRYIPSIWSNLLAGQKEGCAPAILKLFTVRALNKALNQRTVRVGRMLSYPKCSMILRRTNRGAGCRESHNQCAGLKFLLLVQVRDAIYE